MKIKLALLLALITSAGLLAQDAPKPDAPKGDAPKKGEGKGDKGGKKQAPQRPEGIDEATWKKFGEAQKAAQKDEAVIAAKAKADEAKPEDKQVAVRAVAEAVKAAILKADASLEAVFKALEAGRAKGKGDKGKGDKGGKKPEAK